MNIKGGVAIGTAATIIGGSWPGKDLIDGLYNAGYKVGQALTQWL
ncbi:MULTISPECIES: hypothetical protein [Dolosigranulum]|uniref:Class IIb bacteriocin, lactobin A/cerein 7B family n=1 Tax=Dolosigranulum savutiense TaxID=3110288 RepID=A0AB74TGY3_9LACT|nr:hypothetical protein [Dolosigranulum pigrum]